MIDLFLRQLCPSFWAACSAVEGYIEDSNRHYIALQGINEEVEIGLCTNAWLNEG